MNDKVTLNDLRNRWQIGKQEAPHHNSSIKCDRCKESSHYGNWVKSQLEPATPGESIQSRKWECPICSWKNIFSDGIKWT